MSALSTAAHRSRPASAQNLILTAASVRADGVDDVEAALELARCHDIRPTVVSTQDSTYARFQFRSAIPAEQLRTQLALTLDPAPGGAGLRWRLLAPPVRIFVLVSRLPHCLDALLDAHARDELGGGQLVGIAGNHRDLAGRAEHAGLPFSDLPHTDTPARAAHRLLELVEDLRADLVVLARYMRIVPAAACHTVPMINVHHALLPAFAGARAHHQARERGVKLVGATAHYVTPELDQGPIIEQVAERVRVPDPQVADFAAAGAIAERHAVLAAVRLHCAGRVALDQSGRTVLIPDLAAAAESRSA